MKNLNRQYRPRHHRATITVIVVISLFAGSGITSFQLIKNLKEQNNDIGVNTVVTYEPIKAAPTDFISTWNTSALSTGSSGSNQIKLPLYYFGMYDFTVNWGDGSSNTIIKWDQLEITHTYASEGLYTLNISGTIFGWRFVNGGDKLKLMEISQWGDLNLGTSTSYFYGCANLNLTATDAPDLSGIFSLHQAFRNCDNLGSSGDMNNWDVSRVTDMTEMFYSADNFDQNIEKWDVSSVTDMAAMFKGSRSFNQEIGGWDVSSVTDMAAMFDSAVYFNQSINNWDVSSVTDMNRMFDSAVYFNQSINNWDVSSVTDMNRMFDGSRSFNQDMGGWDVSSVTNMYLMFAWAVSFNQNFSGWDVSSVTDMGGMFSNAWDFNQDVSRWDVSSVTDMGGIFSFAHDFDQDIGEWDVSKVTDMDSMFEEAHDFDQDIGEWDVSKVTNMGAMFEEADKFNQDVSRWDVSNATDMDSMFNQARYFNQDIGGWNVSSVTDMGWMFYNANYFNQNIDGWNVSSVTDMGGMFQSAGSFNQDIGSWDVSSVTDMGGMFQSARSFNQDIGSWDVSSVTDMDSMFNRACLSPANYHSLLKGWGQLSLQNGVRFDAGDSQYSLNASEDRQYIIDNFGWYIQDNGIITILPPEADYLQAYAGDGFVSIVWRTPPDLSNCIITTYNISRSNSSEGPFIFLTNCNTTSYMDYAVIKRQTYYYRVQTITEYGYSEYSEIFSTSPDLNISPDDDQTDDDSQSDGIPSYPFGILLISAWAMVFLIQRRRLIKP
ncbi:MAG: BspA family leucine-rich repeat surface protein [Promethearchaeota archaeon]